MSSEYNPITPTQLDAWRRMSESELETEKQNSFDLDIDTVLNQLIFIKRYEREISKCWDKISTVMDERSPRAMRAARPARCAPAALGDSGTMTVAEAYAGQPFDQHTFTYGDLKDCFVVTGIEALRKFYLLHNPDRPVGVPVNGTALLRYTRNTPAAPDAERPRRTIVITRDELQAEIDKIRAEEAAAPDVFTDALCPHCGALNHVLAVNLPYAHCRACLSNLSIAPAETEAPEAERILLENIARPGFERIQYSNLTATLQAAADALVARGALVRDDDTLTAPWWYDALGSEPYSKLGDLHNIVYGPFTSRQAALDDQRRRYLMPPSAAPDAERQAVKLTAAQKRALEVYADSNYIVDDLTIKTRNGGYVGAMDLRTQRALYKRRLIESDGRKYVISAAGRAALAAGGAS